MAGAGSGSPVIAEPGKWQVAQRFGWLAAAKMRACLRRSPYAVAFGSPLWIDVSP